MASYGKVRIYPDGSYDIIASNTQIFDLSPKPPKEGKKTGKKSTGNDGTQAEAPAKPQPKPENIERAMRRARSKVRQLALANQFRWFVTLTLDPEKIDRYDPAIVVRKMSQWADNRVRRKGLAYILVPEHHKDGAIHFHGFFNDALEAVDSGHTDKNGHKVYNLPDWTLGFTRAVELYGDYHAAVGYTCKYIGKGTGKIGGRWYYSGGDLAKPIEEEREWNCFQIMEAQTEEFKERFGSGWYKATPAGFFVGINGMRGEAVHGLESNVERHGGSGIPGEQSGNEDAPMGG